MAVNIDELQVETQAPAPHQAAGAPGQGSGQSNADLKTEIKDSIQAEIERLHEREMRLRAN